MDLPQYWPSDYPKPVNHISLGGHSVWIEMNGQKIVLYPSHDRINADRVIAKSKKANHQTGAWFQSVHMAEFSIGVSVPKNVDVQVDIVVDGTEAFGLYIRKRDTARTVLIEGNADMEDPNTIQPFKMMVPVVVPVDSDDEDAASEEGSVIKDYLGLIEVWMRTGSFKKERKEEIMPSTPGSTTSSGSMWRKEVGPKRVRDKLKARHGHTVSYGPDRPERQQYEVNENNFYPKRGGTRFFVLQYNSEDLLVADRVIPNQLERYKAENEGLRKELAETRRGHQEG